MKTTYFVLILAAVLLVGAVFYFLMNKKSETNKTDVSDSDTPQIVPDSVRPGNEYQMQPPHSGGSSGSATPPAPTPPPPSAGPGQGPSGNMGSFSEVYNGPYVTSTGANKYSGSATQSSNNKFSLLS
jgi:hypothetical protein